MYLFLLGLIIIILIIIFIFLIKIIIYNNYNLCNFNVYELFTNNDKNTYVTNIPIVTMDPLYIDYMLVNSHLLIPKTNAIIKPNPTISPVLYIATESSLLTKLKKENDNIKYETSEFEKKIEKLQSTLVDIKNELQEKEEKKIKLSGEIDDMNKIRYINNKIIKLIVNGMNANIDKERYLANYEKDLTAKQEKIEQLLLIPTPTLAPVAIKEEQIKIITDKLSEIEKYFKELNKKVPENNCSKPIPEPTTESFIFDVKDLQNPTYMWCMCNDDNKKTPECLEYMSCQANYQKNKDKTSLIDDDLTLYMKCINRFTNFPKYLIK